MPVLRCLLALVLVFVCSVAVNAVDPAAPRQQTRHAISLRYDYRDTQAYRALSNEQKSQLNTVRRDMAMLWGALDQYAEEHDGRVPGTLSELVPFFLPELPRDPFSTEETAAENRKDDKNASLDGWGYGYRPGAKNNRAWCLSSAGLPTFPFLAARGNVGLYVCKETWISGKNPIIFPDRD